MFYFDIMALLTNPSVCCNQTHESRQLTMYTSNEQNVHAYYLLSHRLRDLVLFYMKKPSQNLVFPVPQLENL